MMLRMLAGDRCRSVLRDSVRDPIGAALAMYWRIIDSRMVLCRSEPSGASLVIHLLRGCKTPNILYYFMPALSISPQLLNFGQKPGKRKVFGPAN